MLAQVLRPVEQLFPAARFPDVRIGLGDRADDAAVGRAPRRVPQERGLADPRLAPQHEHLALPRPHALQQPIQGVALVAPTA